MFKPNQIPRLKFYIAIIFFVWLSFLVEIPQWDNEKWLASWLKKDSCKQETYQSVPFLPCNFSFQDHNLNFQNHSKLGIDLKRNVYFET